MREVYGAERIRAKKNRIPLIPYTSMAVPLACVIEAAESRGAAKSRFDKIDLWYWTAVFSGRYSHAVESQAYADYKAILTWLDDDDAKLDLAADVNNVVSEMRTASRTSALAKAFYNLLILNGLKDFVTGQPVKLEDCEVDHVFPAAKYPDGAKNIFNLSIIHKDTNRQKSGKLPSEFLKICLDSHAGDKASLLATFQSHFVPAEGVKAMEENNLDAFLAARAIAFQKVLETKVLTRQAQSA
jgi:hypothetical protein